MSDYTHKNLQGWGLTSGPVGSKPASAESLFGGLATNSFPLWNGSSLVQGKLFSNATGVTVQDTSGAKHFLRRLLWL